MQARGLLFIALAAIQMLPPSAHAASSDDIARQKLSEKLLKLSRAENMQETTFQESAAGGKSFNANDGNAFRSTSTYHSNVWSTCLRWIGGRYCDKWLDPYVSEHGSGADQSPLEATVYKEWSKFANGGRADAGQGSGASQYAIWQVDTKDGGSIIDVDGKLNTEVLSRWELLADVKKKVQADGERTAIDSIASTYSYDDTAKKGETLPNMESLRMMAQRWTKMYRNRMVANIGELRAMSRGVEFALEEDVPTCQAYLNKVRGGDVDESRIEERRRRQPLLKPETIGATLDDRMQACMRLRSASVKMVNAQLQGNQVVAGDINAEAYDKVAARLSIDSIDQAGVDINSLERPSWFNLSEDQVSNEVTEFDAGGGKRKTRKTNAQELRSYNRSLESAAVGMTEVAARSGGNIADNSERIRAYKLKPGQVNLVDNNGMTQEMHNELKGTSYPIKSRTAENNPAQNLEDRPHQLTITRSP